MGSLRNPIGPLPSTIYWRRRAVALALLALLAVPVVWALSTGGGDKGSNEGKGGGHGPASSITPGPTDSGPAITQRPGGRDQEDGGGGSTGGDGGSGDAGGAGGGDGSTGGSGAAGGGSPWVPGDGSSGGSGGSSGGNGGSGSGSSDGGAVPAGSSLPDCGSSDVTVTLHSEHKSYAPDQRPKFKLDAVNKRGTACKVDLGRKATTVTVKDSDDKKVWSSDDCTEGAKPALVQVPASGRSTHTFTWFRKPSAENCGTPPAGSAPSGSYKIEVTVQGLKKATAKFKLA